MLRISMSEDDARLLLNYLERSRDVLDGFTLLLEEEEEPQMERIVAGLDEAIEEHAA